MSHCKAEIHQIQFQLGLRHRPRWGSLQRSPNPLARFKGPTSKGKEEEGRKKERGKGKGAVRREGRERRVRERKVGEGEKEGEEEEVRKRGREERDPKNLLL